MCGWLQKVIGSWDRDEATIGVDQQYEDYDGAVDSRDSLKMRYVTQIGRKRLARTSMFQDYLIKHDLLPK